VIVTVRRDRNGVRVDGDRVRNDFDGVAETVIQAGSIATFNYPAPAPGTPKARPALVPAAVGGFTDRVPQLNLVRDLVRGPRAGRPVVVTVRGQPGVGKTALLHQVAMELKDDFPDGALHVSYGVAGASPAQAAGRFLVALGVPEKAVPVAFEHRIDLCRSLTADRRLIMVFDDVSDAGQVTPLLPNSERSLVLVAGTTMEALEELLLDAGSGGRRRTGRGLREPAARVACGRFVADPTSTVERQPAGRASDRSGQ
jgi:hypothetical protein